jgi:sugar diacid utilization regulator
VWVTPIIAGAEHIAVMLSTRSRAFDDAELRTLERAAQVTALLLLTRRSVAAAEQRVRGELLDDLLSSYPVDEAALTRRAQLLGVDLSRSHAVVTARPVDPGRRTQVLDAANAVSGDLGGVAGEHDGSVVCLIPDLPADQAASRVIARLDQLGARATVGAAGPRHGVAQLKAAHRDAARCERILLALGRVGGRATPAELGLYGLLFSGASRDQIDEFIHTRLGPVLGYDAQHDTRLVTTLQVYFDCNGNLVRTAAALYLHVNTLRQRLTRIGDLLGPTWREEGQLELHVAVKIHEIVEAL